MPRRNPSRKTTSSEVVTTRIVAGAALHVSRGEQTSWHAHYAWKVHVGLDAPVWYESDALRVEPNAGARVVVVPPSVTHRVGAVGASVTILVAPGERSTPWRGASTAFVHEGTAALRIVDAANAGLERARGDTSGFVTELLRLAMTSEGVPHPVDVRVRRVLASLARRPDVPLNELATAMGLSLDRLSHLVVEATGTTFRRHALWSRLVGLLSSNKQFVSIASAAAEAGFSDHAHLTRSYRALLGRSPSEFAQSPDAIEPWSGY